MISGLVRQLPCGNSYSRTDFSLLKAISLLCLVLLCGSVAESQTPDTGAVRGFVKDASGAVIQGASIDLENKDTGAKRRLTSDSEGRFEFLVLPLSGRYVLHFSKPGFA